MRKELLQAREVGRASWETLQSILAEKGGKNGI